jgi:hypothetical protein
MRLLWFLSIEAWATLCVSSAALFFTVVFTETCKSTFLAGAPLATQKLDELYIPPMFKM